jgi:hypothetical protein
MKIFRRKKIELCCFVSKHISPYRIIINSDFPDKCEKNEIYIIGNVFCPQYAIFACPCGCGETIELNLNHHSSPCWDIKWHINGKVSFYPSIWRITGCQSHFYLIKSKILWCKK